MPEIMESLCGEGLTLWGSYHKQLPSDFFHKSSTKSAHYLEGFDRFLRFLAGSLKGGFEGPLMPKSHVEAKREISFSPGEPQSGQGAGSSALLKGRISSKSFPHFEQRYS